MTPQEKKIKLLALAGRRPDGSLPTAAERSSETTAKKRAAERQANGSSPVLVSKPVEPPTTTPANPPTVTVTVEGPAYINRFELPTNLTPKSPEWTLWVRNLRGAIIHAQQLATATKEEK